MVRKWKLFIPLLLLVLVVSLLYISNHKHQSQTYFVAQRYQPNSAREPGHLPGSDDGSRPRQGKLTPVHSLCLTLYTL